MEPSPAKVGIAGAKFSRDGQGVYLISDRDGEFAQLRYVNLFTGEKTVHFRPFPGTSRNWRFRATATIWPTSATKAASSKLNVLDLRTHQDLTAAAAAVAGIIDSLSFDAEGKRLAFGFAAAESAARCLRARYRRQSLGALDAQRSGRRRSRQIRHAAADAISDLRPDGRQSRARFPLYVYEPATPGPHPVLISLHGGPESQFRPGFDPWIQYVVNELGFAVVAPNVRGSSGYGKTYLALDNGMLREDAVKDVGALLVWIGLQKHLRCEARGGLRRFLWRLSGARRRWSTTATGCAAASMSAASPISSVF